MSAVPLRSTVYLQLEATYGRRWNGEEYVDTATGFRVVGFTQKRPQKPRSGVLVVKIELAVPGRAFLPLQPSVVVEIPEQLTYESPIEAEAVDPREPTEDD